MLVGQRISQIPPYGLQNYVAGILASLERICHCDRHGLFTLSALFPNFAMKPFRFTPALFGPKSSRTHSAFAARAFYERFLELNHSTIVKKWYSALEGRLRPPRVRSYVLWRSASHSSFVLDLAVLFY